MKAENIPKNGGALNGPQVPTLQMLAGWVAKRVKEIAGPVVSEVKVYRVLDIMAALAGAVVHRLKLGVMRVDYSECLGDACVYVVNMGEPIVVGMVGNVVVAVAERRMVTVLEWQ